MAAQLSTADIKKQLAAKQAAAAAQSAPVAAQYPAPAPTGGIFNNFANGISNTFPSQSNPVLPAAGTGGNPGMSPIDIANLLGIPVQQVIQMQADPTSALQLQATITQAKNQQSTQGFIDNTLTPAGVAAGNQQALARSGLQGVANNQQNLANGLTAGYGQLGTQQAGFANTANAADQAALSGYGANLGVATGLQAGAYNQLAGTLGGMSQLSSTPFTANMQAQQAAVNQANYQTSQAALANYQQAALNQANFSSAGYQGMVGSEAQYREALTQAAQLAQAASDSGDVAAQRAALGQATNMAGGSLDTVNGAGSGGGLAAQQDALAQYSALTSPQATAKEKFLYEQQREAQEQQEAASRAALMNDYRVRGVGGSGMELASILQAGQQNSQQRLLGDLGTQAGAVDRSMQALAGYGNLSTAMTGQSNQVNQANMANRLGAAGLQGQIASNIRGASDAMSQFNTGQANTVGMYNAGQANQGAQFNANAYNQNQQFNANVENQVGAFNANAYNSNQQFNAGQRNDMSMFNTGQANQVGEFNANAYNSNSQFNAGQTQQNNQFNANAYNSNSQFNAGQANSVGMFNAGQTNTVNMSNSQQNQIQSQFADNFRATQQNDAAARATTLANTGITVGQNFATNSGNAFNAQNDVNNSAYNRNTSVTNLGLAGLTAGYNAGTQANNAQGNVFQQQGADAQSGFGRTLAIGDQTIANNNRGSTAVSTGLSTAAGDSAARAAAAQAQKDSQSSGLLGTPILSQNGILGLKGVPIL